jgi:hypothetical protein
MRKPTISALAVAGAMCVPAPALAQRLPFERSFALSEPSILDVSTIRGKIDVRVGEPGRIVVVGTVTIRAAWDVPANAAHLAREVADHPPIELEGSTLRLRAPSQAAQRRAVTVSYQVQVPRDTRVLASSESGATAIDGVFGAVSVRTQSAAIALTHLGAAATVTTGSGAVTVDGVTGALSVITSSSAFSGRALQGDLRVRTSSGMVDAALAGAGDVDVETSSSAIRLRGLKGALTAVSQSGRVSIHGTPGKTWEASTGSGGVDLAIDSGAPFRVEAISRSGSVKVSGMSVQGTVSKGRVAGTVGEGGPLIRVNSRSGSVGITVIADGQRSSPQQ